jgi:membrane protease YdiL (CAAX protease family)
MLKSLTRKQIIAVVLPLLLLAVMYPIFQLLALGLGDQAGWFVGLFVYWLLWGLAYPLWLLGKERVLDLTRIRKFDVIALLLALIPVIFAGIGRIQGVQYEKPTTWVALGLLGTAVGNGIFEEVLWRGTYMALFPDNPWLRIVWPSLGFALWHYAPGSVSSGDVLSLMLGTAFLGLLLGFLARRTDSIGWSILSHTLAGIITVI